MTNERLKEIKKFLEKYTWTSIEMAEELLTYIDELKAQLPNIPDEDTPMGTKVKAWNFKDDIWDGQYIGYDSIDNEHLVKYLNTNDRKSWSTHRFTNCIIIEDDE